MTAFIALLHRDLRVARRELVSFLLRVALNPLMFTFIFGFVMPRMGIIRAGYTDMLLPGILGLSMTLSSMQAVSLPLVIDFGWSKEIEDRLLAPISIAGVGIEKIIVGVVQAIIAGAVALDGSDQRLRCRADYPSDARGGEGITRSLRPHRLGGGPARAPRVALLGDEVGGDCNG